MQQLAARCQSRSNLRLGNALLQATEKLGIPGRRRPAGRHLSVRLHADELVPVSRPCHGIGRSDAVSRNSGALSLHHDSSVKAQHTLGRSPASTGVS